MSPTPQGLGACVPVCVHECKCVHDCECVHKCVSVQVCTSVCKCVCVGRSSEPVSFLALVGLPLSSWDITHLAGSFQKVLPPASSWSRESAVPELGSQPLVSLQGGTACLGLLSSGGAFKRKLGA